MSENRQILNLCKYSHIVYRWKAYFKLINVKMTTMTSKSISKVLQPFEDTDLQSNEALVLKILQRQLSKLYRHGCIKKCVTLQSLFETDQYLNIYPAGLKIKVEISYPFKDSNLQ